MKRFWISLVIIVSVSAFAAAAFYGFKHRRGVPVDAGETARLVLEVPFVEKDIDLSAGLDPGFWDSRPAQSIELVYQLMVLPWPKAGLPDVAAKAFHNGKDIYVHLEWKDDTENTVLSTSGFSDACAVMFPIDKEAQPSSLMMGFLGKANIWHWKADQDREYWLKDDVEPKVYSDFYYQFEKEELFGVSTEGVSSAANELVAIRVGTVTHSPSQDVKGRGVFDSGKWKVVFERSMKAEASGASVQFGRGSGLCAFAVWDGAKGDRAGRKSISNWVQLNIE